MHGDPFKYLGAVVPGLVKGAKRETMKAGHNEGAGKYGPKVKSPKGKAKVEKVMGEFKRGTLKTSAGSPPKNRKQAIAIALSEGRRAQRKKKDKT